MKSILLLALSLFLTNISALCGEGQIDINSASAEELDKIIWVGNATAEKIIANRPFNSIDELTKVSGIGDIKLADIKSQGLACVDKDEIHEDEEENFQNTEETITVKTTGNVVKQEQVYSPRETELETINLNPKAIKSEENSEVSGKRNYAVYGLLAFGVLLGLLFLIKGLIKRQREKDEFA